MIPSWRKAALLVPLATVLLLTSCSSSGTENPKSTESSGANIASVDRNATLKAGWTLSATTWDPLKWASPNASASFLTMVYDQLVELGPDLKPAPGIAKSWTEAADGKSLTLQLRDDVKFADGTKLDANTVKANLDRARQPDSLVLSSLSSVSDVSVVGPLEVKISFSVPTYNLVNVLAQDTRVSSMVDPRAFDDPSLATKPRGTGPYSLVSASTSSTIYERVPDHWDTTSGLAKRVELSKIVDTSARINALRTGAVDLIFAPEDQAGAVAQAGQAVWFKDTPALRAVLVNYTRPPLDNPDVREAISLALDRAMIAKTAYNGACRPTQQIFTPRLGGFSAELDSDAALTPNIARAKELMKQAGQENGLSVKMASPAGDIPAQKAIQIMQQSLAEIGVKVSITEVPAVQIGPDLAAGKFDMTNNTTNAALESQYAITLNIESKGKGFGIPDYLKDAAAAAAAMPLGAERDKAYQAISKTLTEKPTLIPICNNDILVGVSTKVVGAENMAYGKTVQGIIDLRRVGIAG